MPCLLPQWLFYHTRATRPGHQIKREKSTILKPGSTKKRLEVSLFVSCYMDGSVVPLQQQLKKLSETERMLTKLQYKNLNNN